jgi:SAM-dependent methyltransferase
METNLFSSNEYRESNDIYRKSLGRDYGNVVLGQNTSRILVEDPKLLLFTLSRYKFVSKMLNGSKSTLEIGCQEGFGANLIFPVVGNYYGIDFYKPYIEFAQNNCRAKNAQFLHGDILDHQIEGLASHAPFESCFALDVLEHIDAKDEDEFMLNVLKMLDPLQGKMIIGMPSLESQIYASEASRKGHINCKT